MSAPGDRDVYRSIADGPEVEVRVKGSRFAGQAFAARDEATARARLDGLRRRYHDATHHCSAWRVGPPGATVERSDDDGEPSGTGGRPILAALEGRRLHDALVVVTRWFGGTKLGTGGLVRAYGEAAGAALEAARPVLRTIEAVVRASFGFDDVGPVEAVLAREGEAVLRVDRTFEPSPAVRIAVRRSRAAGLAAALVEATAGRADVRIEEGGDGSAGGAA